MTWKHWRATDTQKHMNDTSVLQHIIKGSIHAFIRSEVSMAVKNHIVVLQVLWVSTHASEHKAIWVTYSCILYRMSLRTTFF